MRFNVDLILQTSVLISVSIINLPSSADGQAGNLAKLAERLGKTATSKIGYRDGLRKVQRNLREVRIVE
jgi:hypothetical protein